MTGQENVEKVPLHVGRIVTAWIIAFLTALSSVLFLPTSDRFELLVLSLGIAVLASFILQLGTAQREGFITRVAFSVVGSLIVIIVVELCAFLLGSR